MSMLPPDLEKADDAALILAVQAGDHQAFEPLLDIVTNAISGSQQFYHNRNDIQTQRRRE